jgi:hypothetical protein
MIKKTPNTEKTIPIRIFKPFNKRFVTRGRKYFAPKILNTSIEKNVRRITIKK